MREERGVAGGDGLVVVVDGGARDELSDAGAADVLSVAGACDQVGREAVLQVHSGENAAVVARAGLPAAELLARAADRLGVGEWRRAPGGAAGLLLGGDHLQRAGALGRGVLDAHAGEDVEPAELRGTHHVRGADFLGELLVVDQLRLQVGGELRAPPVGMRRDIAVDVVDAADRLHGGKWGRGVFAELGVRVRTVHQPELREVVVVAPAGGGVGPHHAVGADVDGVVGRVVEVAALPAVA